MQDTASSPTLRETSDRLSRVSENYHTGSKPTTATHSKRRVPSHRATFRPDLTVSARTGNRHEKKYSYAPPASDRESWWRVTIKVYFSKTICH